MLNPSSNNKSNKNSLVSVIVPIYNVEQYLKKCVDSLLNQYYENYEIILVDDGSPDKCGEICEEYRSKYDNIRVIHKENGGLSDARNAGIEIADGEYLTFVDSDDYVEPTFISYLVSLIKSQPKCKVAHCNHYIERGKKVTTNAPVKGEITVFTQKEAVDAVLYHDRVDVCVWGGIFSCSIFDEVKFPKGRVFEDTYIFADVISQTEVYVYGDIPQYHYIQREGSIVNQGFKLKNLEYIDSVRRLTDYVMKEYPEMEKGCHRRLAHSYLSVLRYMEHVETSYRGLRNDLREKALQYKYEVCKDARTPQRDKVALILLAMGFFVYYKGWNLYSKLRK